MSHTAAVTHRRRSRLTFLLPLLFCAVAFPLFAAPPRAQAQVGTSRMLISEFRFRGPALTDLAGVSSPDNDEFIELYNNSDQPFTVQASDASGGWSVGSSLPVLAGGLPPYTVLFTIPNGTVIPARGHYLGVNTNGYTLGSYASGNASYTVNLPDDGGIALFNTADPFNYNFDTRMDAVGYNPPPELGDTAKGKPRPLQNTPLFVEGNGLTASVTFPNEHSFVRFQTTGPARDTDNNADDFVLVSTDPGAFKGPLILLGAPGPENLASPTQRNGIVKSSLIDPQCTGFGAASSACRFVRNGTPVTNGSFGTLAIRRTFTNTTGASISRLRFRVVDITTLNGQAGNDADVRALSNSADVVVTRQDSTTVTLRALTLEQPPAQPSGGGLNSSVGVGSITLGTPLANGASVSVQFLLGVEQNGNYRYLLNVEAATGGSVPLGTEEGKTLKGGAAGTGLRSKP